MRSPILVALTPSPNGRAALALAVRLAHLTDRPLVLGGVALRASVMPDDPAHGWTSEVVDVTALRARASKDLHAMAATVPSDVHTRVAVADAFDVATAIEQLALRHQAELIVLGSTHRSLLTRVVDGDAILGVLRHATCPVVVASAHDGDDESHEVPEFSSIAIAWDRSLEATQALAYAAELAHRSGAALRVVHVLEPQAPVFMPPADPKIGREQTKDRTRQAETEIRHAIEALTHDVSAEIDVRPGKIDDELVKLGADVDLLVIGSRRAGAMRRVTSGSVSAHLAHHAKCPILVTPRGVGALTPA